VGKGDDGWQQGHGEEEREARRGGERERPGWCEQKRQDDQAGQGVLRQDVAVPDQEEMDETEGQQDEQAPQQEDQPSRMAAQPFELDRKADTEQQGKDRERLEVDEGLEERIDPGIRPGHPGTVHEPLEDRDAELGLEIHGENAKQRQAAQGVEGIDALSGRDWSLQLRSLCDVAS
jgi:hypothetical protein